MRTFTDRFQLQFPGSSIKEIAARYCYRLDDENAFSAGADIVNGNSTRKNLEIIFRWKTGGRGVGRLSKNTDEEISDALRLAHAASTQRAAVAVLCGLYGINVPVASAILTVMKPGRYTIIDFRALESLGSISPDRSIDFYLHYLSKCRDLATEHDVDLRTLDRALWQWSKERPQTRNAEISGK